MFFVRHPSNKALGHIFGMSLSQLQAQLCFNSETGETGETGFPSKLHPENPMRGP